MSYELRGISINLREWKIRNLSCVICERIWKKKGPLCAEAEFLYFIAHIFDAVMAIGSKPGMTHYTRCKFCAPPTSSLGVCGGRECHVVKNRPFYVSAWSSTISGNNIATPSNVDFFGRRAQPGVSINQDWSERLLVTWCLQITIRRKLSKFGVLHEKWTFFSNPLTYVSHLQTKASRQLNHEQFWNDSKA